MKPSSGKIMTLEGARFLAAFSVMALHTTNEIIAIGHFPSSSLPLAQNLFAGAAPVAFFFVLSGFVMYNGHHQDFGQLKRLPRYVLSRVSRVFPLYWLSILAGQAVWDVATHSWSFLPPPHLQMFLLLPTQWPIHTVEGNPVAWTLRYEVAFYVSFMMAFIPRIGPWLLGLWFVAIIWYCYPPLALSQWLSGVTGSNPGFWPVAIISHAVNLFSLLFFAGLLGGVIHTHCHPGRRLARVLFGLACMGLVWEIWHEGGGQRYPLPNFTFQGGLLYAFWIAAAAMAERAGALPRWGGFRPLGVLSYPLYLFHGFVLLAFTFWLANHSAFAHRLPGAVWFVFLVAVSFAISAIAAWGIDRPLQIVIRKYLIL